MSRHACGVLHVLVNGDTSQARRPASPIIRKFVRRSRMVIISRVVLPDKQGQGRAGGRHSCSAGPRPRSVVYPGPVRTTPDACILRMSWWIIGGQDQDRRRAMHGKSLQRPAPVWQQKRRIWLQYLYMWCLSLPCPRGYICFVLCLLRARTSTASSHPVLVLVTRRRRRCVIDGDDEPRPAIDPRLRRPS